MSEKVYLGDGCYASFDGYAITLTTSNGIATTNEIYLEPEVYLSLVAFRQKCVGAAPSVTSGIGAESQEKGR